MMERKPQFIVKFDLCEMRDGEVGITAYGLEHRFYNRIMAENLVKRLRANWRVDNVELIDEKALTCGWGE